MTCNQRSKPFSPSKIKKYFYNEQVVERLQKLVQTERKITHLVLECINEIEIRKIHLERGYSSLFDFLTQKMGYTPSAAQRRIDGARLLRQIPEIAQKNRRRGFKSISNGGVSKVNSH